MRSLRNHPKLHLLLRLVIGLCIAVEVVECFYLFFLISPGTPNGVPDNIRNGASVLAVLILITAVTMNISRYGWRSMVDKLLNVLGILAVVLVAIWVFYAAVVILQAFNTI